MFLPDSLGYFASASLLGAPAYALGRPRAAAIAGVLVAISSFLVRNLDPVALTYLNDLMT